MNVSPDNKDLLKETNIKIYNQNKVTKQKEETLGNYINIHQT